MTVQISFAAQGGSGAPPPDRSIEIEDVDAAIEHVRDAGFAVEPTSNVRAAGARCSFSETNENPVTRSGLAIIVAEARAAVDVIVRLVRRSRRADSRSPSGDQSSP